MKRRRIALVISTLGCGGAERVAAALANGLHVRGREVAIITLCGPQPPFYELSQSVKVIPLDVMRASQHPKESIRNNLSRIILLRQALVRYRPDLVAAFLTESNVLTLLAGRAFGRLSCPIVVTEHTNPDVEPSPLAWRIARRITYPFADHVVACSKGVANRFGSLLPPSKVQAICNPVILDDRSPDVNADRMTSRMAGERWIIGMGRLSREKGFDLLLEAYARLSPQVRKGWKLGIVGEGEMRADLEREIASLGIRSEAELLGNFKNPYPVLRSAKLFVLSSRYEGFGICLAEAMACGVPVVAFDCKYGPREIVRDEVDGLLVPPRNIELLSGALSRLIGDEGLRRRLALKAPEAIERFSEERFLNEWEALIARLCGG